MKISVKEEHIGEIMSGQDETVGTGSVKPVYDLPALQSRKYLFVGHVDSDFRELRRVFPGSIFMTENTDDISGIKVDAVVYLIKCMSHSMYYKVQSVYGTSEMPIIRFNGKNLEMLYQERQKGMEE